MRNEEKLPEETPEEIALKALTARAKTIAKGPVLIIEVEDINEDKSITKRYGFFKMPDRMVVGLAMGMIKKNPVEANEFILMKCLIPEVSNIDLSKDTDFWACCPHTAPLLDYAEEKKSSSRMA